MFAVDVEINSTHPVGVGGVESTTELARFFSAENTDLQCADDATWVVEVDGVGALWIECVEAVDEIGEQGGFQFVAQFRVGWW